MANQGHAEFILECAGKLQTTLDHPLVKSAFQFIRRAEIADSRLSRLCKTLSGAGLEGTNIFYLNDPLWKSLFSPPSYENCRCGAIALTLDMAAKNLAIAQRWLETGVKPSDEELCVRPPKYGNGRPVRLSSIWIARRKGSPP